MYVWYICMSSYLMYTNSEVIIFVRFYERRRQQRRKKKNCNNKQNVRNEYKKIISSKGIRVNGRMCRKSGTIWLICALHLFCFTHTHARTNCLSDWVSEWLWLKSLKVKSFCFRFLSLFCLFVLFFFNFTFV